jgi:hypothetical protein
LEVSIENARNAVLDGAYLYKISKPKRHSKGTQNSQPIVVPY